MGLSDRRRLFFQIRSKCQVIVKNHAFLDYPKRGFSKLEIVNLIRSGVGQLQENPSPDAIEGSFLFLVKDDLGKPCKLVVLVEEVEIEDVTTRSKGTKKETVIVCSAYREVSHEIKKN